MRKKAAKMTSQLVIFRVFFLFFFLRLPDPKSEKKSRKSANIKKLLACTSDKNHY